MLNWKKALIFAAGAFIALPAAAQEFPTKPITLVVNSAAGGPVDLTARVMQDEMARLLGQPIIIENRVGAGGVTGAASVARAPADGYTILMSGPGPMVLAPQLYTTVPYVPLDTFATINLAVDVPVVLAMSAKVQAETLQEFIALAEKNPGEITYGTAGIGTPAHLGSELFKKLADIDMLFIPYPGSPEALQALTTGELSMHISTPAVAYPHVAAGTVRLLAVSGDKRLDRAPDVPTFAEAGMSEMAVPAWFGLFTLKGTPPEIIEVLDQAARKALSLPKAKETLGNAAFNIKALGAAEFDEFLKSETDKWGTFIRENNIKVE